MKLNHLNLSVWLAFVAAPTYGQAPVARVGDVTRIQGQGPNVLIGYGLVTGLDRTGDDVKFLPTMQALKSMIERFGVSIDSINDIAGSKNTAVVMVEVVIPAHGAREGGLIDTNVTAVAASSLAGGRLLPTPLVYHDRAVEGLFGFAQGRIELNGSTETSGVVHNGARMERDLFVNVVVTGAELRSDGFSNPWIQPNETYITLVLDDAHAGWSMAAATAQAVDKELSLSAEVERVALAMDSHNVVVLLPEHQRSDLASWIRDVEQTPILMESNEARVTINRSAGTIVITGDTRLSPVIVSQKGMTVTIAAPLEDGTIPVFALEQGDFVPLDSGTNRQSNVRDLLEALNRLKTPFKDRVSILEEIHRAGKLHAQLLYQG